MSNNNINNEVSKILNQYKELHKISGADVESLSDEDVASIFGQDLKDKKLDGMTVNDDGQPIKLLNGFSEEIEQKKLDDITEAYTKLAEANNKAVPVQQQQNDNRNVDNKNIENKSNENQASNGKLVNIDEIYAQDSAFSSLVQEHDTLRAELDKLEVQYGFNGENVDEAVKAKMKELNGKIAANINAQESRRQELWKTAGISDNTVTQNDDLSVQRAKYNAANNVEKQQNSKENVENNPQNEDKETADKKDSNKETKQAANNILDSEEFQKMNKEEQVEKLRELRKENKAEIKELKKQLKANKNDETLKKKLEEAKAEKKALKKAYRSIKPSAFSRIMRIFAPIALLGGALGMLKK